MREPRKPTCARLCRVLSCRIAGIVPSTKEFTLCQYEEILGYPTHEEANEKWIKAQRAEISAFEETLRRLQKRGYGALVNRLDFRERV
ncbi:MAG: hypothetical protein ACM30D_13210 [Hyphomicrobiales bacterium]|jgi:hypothetical protein|nr:hypothetical protein [Xanthobacteraceae bacterium]